jgi:hypothetical protein
LKRLRPERIVPGLASLVDFHLVRNLRGAWWLPDSLRDNNQDGRFRMIKKITALLAASALVAAPTAAAASTAVPADVRASAEMERSDALVGARSTSIMLGLLILVAIIAIAVTSGDGDPVSP